MSGLEISASSVEELAKLPPLDVLRGQVLGAIIAPLSAIAALVNAPLQNLYGLIDARIEQLQAQGETLEPDSAEPSQIPESEEPTEPQEADEDGSS
jgi:hypothetical protein